MQILIHPDVIHIHFARQGTVVDRISRPISPDRQIQNNEEIIVVKTTGAAGIAANVELGIEVAINEPFDVVGIPFD